MLEQAAQDLGATPLVTFRKVTRPLIFPGILAGALLYRANLAGALLVEAKLPRAQLDGANLSDASLVVTNLPTHIRRAFDVAGVTERLTAQADQPLG